MQRETDDIDSIKNGWKETLRHANTHTLTRSNTRTDKYSHLLYQTFLSFGSNSFNHIDQRRPYWWLLAWIANLIYAETSTKWYLTWAERGKKACKKQLEADGNKNNVQLTVMFFFEIETRQTKYIYVEWKCWFASREKKITRFFLVLKNWLGFTLWAYNYYALRMLCIKRSTNRFGILTWVFVRLDDVIWRVYESVCVCISFTF